MNTYPTTAKLSIGGFDIEIPITVDYVQYFPVHIRTQHHTVGSLAVLAPKPFIEITAIRANFNGFSVGIGKLLSSEQFDALEDQILAGICL